MLEPTRGRPADPLDTRTPGWLDLIVQWAALGVVAVGVIGLPLLLVGLFKEYLVLPGAAVVWLALVFLRRGARAAASGRVSWTTHAIGAAAVLVAIADFLVNAKESTQHLLVDGDPAVYGMTGKWIAEHGTLNIPIHQAWFGNDQTINYMTNGFFLRPDGHHLYPQFFHLLPALLAVGDWFGGTGGLLHLEMAIGAFALLAVFAFATRLMPPIWALAAMVTLSLTLPQLFFSRDTFSEIPSQFLVFAGLAMLCDATKDRCARPGVYGFLAGLTLGASTMARIDAFVYLAPVLVAVVAVALVAARSDPRRRALARVAVTTGVGFGVTGVIGLADAVFGSPAYADSVTSQLIAVGALTALVIVVGALVLARPAVGDFATRLGGFLPRLAASAGGLVVVVLAFAWFVRPRVQTTHETGVLDVAATIANLQKNENAPIDPTRHYNEMTVRWLGWYIGPIALALAILGLGYLTYRVLRGRDLHLLPFLLLAGVVSAIYIYDPGIVPVQYWASRRFVPVTFPALLLLAFFLLARVFEAARSGSRPAALRWTGGVVVVALGVVTLATPVVLLTGHVRLVRAYVPVRDVVNRLCAALQPSDTVLLVGAGAQTNGFVQTIETYCGNAAAVAGTNTETPDIVRMANAAAASGHRLVLISSQQQPVDDSGKPLGLTLGVTVDSVVFKTEALSLTHRPDAVFPVQLPVFLAPAPLR